MISIDGRSTVIPVPIVDAEIETVDELRTVAEGNGEGGFEVLLAGPGTLNADTTTIAEEDLQKSEMVGLGMALIVLVVVFGSLIAALLPLSMALVAIPIAFGGIALIAELSGVHFALFTTNVATSIGLAVGIDYSLFIIARYREERKKGFDPLGAIVASGATARSRRLLQRPHRRVRYSSNNPWVLVGPTNIGGRISDIEMSRTNFDTIYAGIASGGVFKSNDGGLSWSPIFGETYTMSIGDLVVDPTNPKIIYVGTGEVNGGGGSVTTEEMEFINQPMLELPGFILDLMQQNLFQELLLTL